MLFRESHSKKWLSVSWEWSKAHSFVQILLQSSHVAQDKEQDQILAAFAQLGFMYVSLHCLYGYATYSQIILGDS